MGDGSTIELWICYGDWKSKLCSACICSSDTMMIGEDLKDLSTFKCYRPVIAILNLPNRKVMLLRPFLTPLNPRFSDETLGFRMHRTQFSDIR